MKKYIFERSKHVEEKLNDDIYPLGGIELDEDNVVMFKIKRHDRIAAEVADADTSRLVVGTLKNGVLLV